MARAWLINSRGIAKKVRNASRFSDHQIKDLGAEANRECPNCKHLIDNSDVYSEWPGLPAGVKFDPTDVELLEHLAGKVGLGNSKAHAFIDEFIPTLEDGQGICYTHPENLPGVKKDGNSVHFFHRTSNAYASGHRKRRRIHSQCSSTSDERLRWHKTGKTKPVLESAVHKGWKKIMVLYRSSEKSSKPEKTNWVMHQYHLGNEEEEKDGELVVSKIFYQQNAKQIDKTDAEQMNEEQEPLTARTSPRTPNTNTPPPLWRKKHSPLSEAHENNPQLFRVQNGSPQEAEEPLSVAHQKVGPTPLWWAGESQGIEELDQNITDEMLRCHEVLDKFPSAEESSIWFNYQDMDLGRNETLESNANNPTCGFPDLDNIETDIPDLADLQFGSQESITSWLDRL